MNIKSLIGSILIYGSAIFLFIFGTNHWGLHTLSMSEFIVDTACLFTMLVGLKLSGTPPRLFKFFIALFALAFLLSNYGLFRFGWQSFTGFPAPTALLAIIAIWLTIVIVLTRSKPSKECCQQQSAEKA